MYPKDTCSEEIPETDSAGNLGNKLDYMEIALLFIIFQNIHPHAFVIVLVLVLVLNLIQGLSHAKLLQS